LLILCILALVGIVALLIHIGLGSTVRIAPWDVFKEILRGDTGGDDPINSIVWRLRLPRAIGCLLIGGLLGMVGSAFQALFRNPLAEPYIVGVSSGSAVGGALAMVTGFAGVLGGMGIMLASFVTGLMSLAIVFVIASRRGVVQVQTLLLAGVVIGAMLSSVLSLVLLAAGQDTNQVLRWLLGSTTPMYWNRIVAMAVVFVLGGWVLIRQTKRLNAFAVSEETAQRLGVDTSLLKSVVLIAGTAMTAVAVGSAGIIGFLGLVAPHISRRIVGVDWRWSLPGSAFLGSSLLLFADIIAQQIRPGIEMPVGIVTAVLGAPFLLVLIRRKD
jgi:iron complex transport system permease protein